MRFQIDRLIPTDGLAPGGTSGLDRPAVRRAFERAASSYDAAASLQREVAVRLDERLDGIRIAPRRILDAGCGTGYGLELLARRYPQARCVALDLARAMARTAQRQTGAARFKRLRLPWSNPNLHFVCGDIESLPLPDRSVDLIFSSLALQWCDLVRAFSEFARVLAPGGLIMFTSFGPDTLTELRSAWAQADQVTPPLASVSASSLAPAAHVHGFPDMHDVGDVLLGVGLTDPVMDVERMTPCYPDTRALLSNLKAIGAHNAHSARRHTLTGRVRYARFVAAYEALRRADGLLPATYELVFGQAWARQTWARQTGARQTGGGHRP